MGVFTVETKITNWQSRFLPEDERGDEVTCAALVDTGAVELALPAELIERLRLVEVGVIRVETADGAYHRYRLMGIAEIEVEGRTCRVQALGEMDWHISPTQKRLVPNPRWPDLPTQPLM